jgi:formyltetrahydrofolate-dependent phosphoribosylglycinamide formyltransferase
MTEKGFAVKRPWYWMDTALAARWGTVGPCVAFQAEYDALPGYGENGDQAGHACGHNWIAATTVGAAVALKMLCEQNHIPVRILLAGCPEEETFGSKSLLARDGAFEGVDCALQAHLSEETNLYHRSLALTAMEIRYYGKAAHAAAAPWEGINALDAIQLYYAGVAALRQQLRPDVRLHGVIKEGGLAANSIPERASCLYYARAAQRKYLDQVVERLLDVAKGAAMMTGARLEVRWPEQPMDDTRQIPALQAVMDGCKAQQIRARVALVISNTSDSMALQRAAAENIPHFHLSAKKLGSEEALAETLLALFAQYEIDMIFLAGYMRLVGETLLEGYGGRIINIHPSLLPAFRGARAIEQALEAGVKVFGVTIHEVDASLDGGRILAQRAFEYEGHDQAELEELIHQVEYPLYVETIRKIITNK